TNSGDLAPAPLNPCCKTELRITLIVPPQNLSNFLANIGGFKGFGNHSGNSHLGETGAIARVSQKLMANVTFLK
ncbi:MAG: hypothetical protein ACYT04_80310, partial [Nostoc sp.]